MVNKVRRDKCRGRIKEVLKRSDLETAEPMCPKFGVCGGCNYQTLPYEEQLNLKKTRVLKLIDEVYRPMSRNRENAENNFIDGIFAFQKVSLRKLMKTLCQKNIYTMVSCQVLKLQVTEIRWSFLLAIK